MEMCCDDNAIEPAWVLSVLAVFSASAVNCRQKFAIARRLSQEIQYYYAFRRCV